LWFFWVGGFVWFLFVFCGLVLFWGGGVVWVLGVVFCWGVVLVVGGRGVPFKSNRGAPGRSWGVFTKSRHSGRAATD